MKKICLLLKSEIFLDSTLKEVVEYNERQIRGSKNDILVISDNPKIAEKCQFYKIEFIEGNQLYAKRKEIDIMIIEHKLPDMNAFIIHKYINQCVKHNIYSIYISQDKEQVFNAFDRNVMGYIYVKKNLDMMDFEKKLRATLYKIYMQQNQSQKEFLLYGKISSDMVEYIKADNIYVEIHMVNGDVYLERDKISEVEKKLSKYNFALSHRSYLVNVEYIREIRSKSVQLIYSCIPMSKQRKIELERLLSCEMNK